MRLSAKWIISSGSENSPIDAFPLSFSLAGINGRSTFADWYAASLIFPIRQRRYAFVDASAVCIFDFNKRNFRGADVLLRYRLISNNHGIKSHRAVFQTSRVSFTFGSPAFELRAFVWNFGEKNNNTNDNN